jgi:hypothetical protein
MIWSYIYGLMEVAMPDSARRASVQQRLDKRRTKPPSNPPTADFCDEEVTDVIDVALCRLEKAAVDGVAAKRVALAEVAKIRQAQKL